MGSINFDGTLRRYFTVAGTRELDAIGLSIGFYHDLSLDADGNARSEWEFNGIKSFISPYGRQHLQWQPLSGHPVLFQSLSEARRISYDATGKWRLAWLSASRLVVESLAGSKWYYHKGNLVEIFVPSVGRYRILTNGVRVREVRLAANNADKIIFSADYSRHGRLLYFLISPIGISFDRTGWLYADKSFTFSYDDEDRLVSFNPRNGDGLQFFYRNGLISRIAIGKNHKEDYLWGANRGYGRGDSLWPHPVFLQSDNYNVYNYNFTPKGFILSRKTKSGKVLALRYNPRLRRIDHLTGEDRISIAFAAGGIGRDWIRIVYDESGRIIERFRLGDLGEISYDTEN